MDLRRLFFQNRLSTIYSHHMYYKLGFTKIPLILKCFVTSPHGEIYISPNVKFSISMWITQKATFYLCFY